MNYGKFGNEWMATGPIDAAETPRDLAGIEPTSCAPSRRPSPIRSAPSCRPEEQVETPAIASDSESRDPLEPLVVAVQEAIAEGEPLPNFDHATLSDADRLRLHSVCRLIKTLHRLPKPTAQSAESASRVVNVAGLAAVNGHLGRFRIERLLGHGGHGVVYLAFDPILNRHVALKIPRPEVLIDPAMRERFVREARAAAKLDHPSIVPIYESGTVGEVCFIAMAYCSDGSLEEFLANHRCTLTSRGWAKLFLQLAEALEFTHRCGVLHRDLKPGNVLLFPLADGTDCSQVRSGDVLSFVPKLTDFGLARIVEESAEQTRTTLGGGTPLYMSPELATLQGKVDARSDVHSLGAVMYEALTGRVPYEGDSLLDLLEAIRHRIPPPPHVVVASLPRDLSTICLKCLEKRPRNRYQSAGALAVDLRRFLNHEPIEAKPTSWSERFFLWCQRRPTVAAFVAFAALAMAVGFMGLLLHWQQVSHLDALNQAARYNRLVYETEGLAARPQLGWSWEGLDKLGEVLTYDVAADDVVKLRSALSAFLTGNDLRQVASIAPGIRGYCLAFSTDGRKMAIGENNNEGLGNVRVEVWDFESRKRLWRLTFPVGQLKFGQPDGVRSLIFTRDGRRLIAGSRQGGVHFWDLANSPPPLRSWRPHGGWVTGLAELDNGDVLTVSEDGTIRDLNVNSGQALTVQTFDKDISDLRVTKLRRADGMEQSVIAVGIGEHLRILSSPKGELFQNWRPPFPLGRILGPFVGQNSIFTATDRRVFLVDLEHEANLRTFIDTDIIDNSLAHDGEVRSLDLSPGGAVLATGAGDGRVKLWDMPTGKLLSNIFLSAEDNIALRFHPSGRYLAVANGMETRIFEMRGASFAGVAALQRAPLSGFGLKKDRLVTVATALPGQLPDDIQANTVDDRHSSMQMPFYVTDLKSYSLRDSTEDRNDRILCDDALQPVSFTLHPDRSVYAYFGGHDIAEIHLEKGHREILQHELQAIAFSADGQCLWGTYAVKHPDYDKSIGAIGAWRLSDLAKVSEWVNIESRRTGGLNGLYSLVVGGSTIAAASSDATVKLFKPTMSVPELVGTIATERDEGESLAFSPSESLLAIGTKRGDLILAQTSDRRVVFKGAAHSGMVSTIAFTSDGQLLATGSHDHFVRLWQIREGHPEMVLTLPRQSNRIIKVAFGPNDDSLYVLVRDERSVRTFAVKLLRAELARLGLGFDRSGR